MSTVESAPPLHDVAGHDELGLPHSIGRSMVRKSRIAPTTKVLRVVALLLSVIILGLLITNLVILDAGYFQYYWGSKHRTEVFLKWMIPILIVSIINVIIRIPGLLNIIPDTTFTTGVIICLVRLIDEFPQSQWCEERRWPKPEPAHPRCMEQKRFVTLIMAAAAGLGIALAATYIALLCLRALVIFNSRFWERFNFNTQDGGVSFSISLNVIKDENETSFGISAGSRRMPPKGQGQVHL